MKVALVQPPNPQRSGDWKKMKVSRPPINLALLASHIRNFDHEPFVYDFDWCDDSIEDMAKLILSKGPDVVGFTCLTPRIKIVLQMAARIKEKNKNVITLIGGVHVSAVLRQSLYTDDIDYAIYGESEGALVELLDALDNKKSIENVPNLIYRKDDEIRTNPTNPLIENLDEMPLPAWDLLNLQDYTDPATFDGIHMGVMTARGCPWDCIFCSSKVTWGRKVRFRSAENVIEELDYIVNKLGIANIMFYDDTFTVKKSRFLKICDEMVKRKLNLRYYSQVRVDTVDEEVADALARSGCIAAAIGVESGDEKILKVLRKEFTKDNVRKAVAALKRADVHILATYVLGSPGETKESVEKTFAFAKELDTDQAKFMICTPFPGTESYKIAVQKGLLPDHMSADEWSEFTYYQHVAANLSDMSDEVLLDCQRRAYTEFKQRHLEPSKKVRQPQASNST